VPFQRIFPLLAGLVDHLTQLLSVHRPVGNFKGIAFGGVDEGRAVVVPHPFPCAVAYVDMPVDKVLGVVCIQQLYQRFKAP